jgi:hypothetical protein
MPLINSPTSQTTQTTDLEFPGWPRAFEGKPLTALPLSARERQFLTDYPGKIARFNDGSRELIIPWLKRPTRKLHCASDGFRALDYRITPSAVRADGKGELWSIFSAQRERQELQVYERNCVYDGNSCIRMLLVSDS